MKTKGDIRPSGRRTEFNIHWPCYLFIRTNSKGYYLSKSGKFGLATEIKKEEYIFQTRRELISALRKFHVFYRENINRHREKIKITTFIKIDEEIERKRKQKIINRRRSLDEFCTRKYQQIRDFNVWYGRL